MSKQPRKRLDAAAKASAVKRHLMDKVPVSKICEEMGIQPSAFYTWQHALFARAEALFDLKPGARKIDRSEEKVAALEDRLARKDAVIAELLQEHVELKKTLGVN